MSEARREEMLDFLYDLESLEISEYEGKPFAILESWEQLSDVHEALNAKFNPEAWAEWKSFYNGNYEDLRLGVKRLPNGAFDCWASPSNKDARSPYLVPEGLVELEGVLDWGFYDEYSTCCECNQVIRTQPNGYAWTPDYWESGAGYVCGDCVQLDPDEYIEDRVEHSRDGKAVTCNLVDPEDHEFRLIVEGLETGLHKGQNDDPRSIAAWAGERELETVFTVRNSQFTQTFDVWMRWSSSRNDAELNDSEVGGVRYALLVDPEDRYTALRPEFRQWPSPADNMKAALKAVTLP